MANNITTKNATGQARTVETVDTGGVHRPVNLSVPMAAATGGCDVYRSLDLDETEEEVKATAGVLYGYSFSNLSGAIRYLKFYDNTAAGTTVGTTVPKMTLALPFATSNACSGHISISPPIAFATGITIACTTGLADNNTGAPGANDVVVNISYK